MPTIYANDFAGITQGELAAGAQRQAAQQAAIQNFMAGRELALRHALVAKDQGLKEREMLLKEQSERRRAIDEAEKTRQSGEYLKLQTPILQNQALAPNPTEQRAHDLAIGRAAQDAETGAFDNGTHVLTLYPTLKPDEADALAARSTRSRQYIESDYKTALNAADVLNRQDALMRQKKADEAAQAAGHNLIFPDTSDSKAAAARLKTAEAERTLISGKASKLQQDKRMMGLVTYDPAADKYVPAVPAPSWRASVQPSTSTSAPKQQPQTGTGTTQPDRGLTQSWVPQESDPLAVLTRSAVRPLAPQQGNGSVVGPFPPIRDEAPAGPIAPQTGTTPQGIPAAKFEPYFYQRVNELIGTGLPPAAAKARAMAERDVGYP